MENAKTLLAWTDTATLFKCARSNHMLIAILNFAKQSKSLRLSHIQPILAYFWCSSRFKQELFNVQNYFVAAFIAEVWNKMIATVVALDAVATCVN